MYNCIVSYEEQTSSIISVGHEENRTSLFGKLALEINPRKTFLYYIGFQDIRVMNEFNFAVGELYQILVGDSDKLGQDSSSIIQSLQDNCVFKFHQNPEPIFLNLFGVINSLGLRFRQKNALMIPDNIINPNMKHWEDFFDRVDLLNILNYLNRRKTLIHKSIGSIEGKMFHILSKYEKYAIVNSKTHFTIFGVPASDFDSLLNDLKNSFGDAIKVPFNIEVHLDIYEKLCKLFKVYNDVNYDI